MEELRIKKNLIAIDEHLQVLRKAYGSVGLIKAKSIKTECHRRAITSTATMIGLGELIGDLERGQEMCMDILGAKKIPIVVERKLKLVVNNENGGK